MKLQLLGRDAPYYRASNGTFSIEAQNVAVSLPTSEPFREDSDFDENSDFGQPV